MKSNFCCLDDSFHLLQTSNQPLFAFGMIRKILPSFRVFFISPLNVVFLIVLPFFIQSGFASNIQEGADRSNRRFDIFNALCPHFIKSGSIKIKAAGQCNSPNLIAGNMGVFDGFYPFADS